MQNYLEGLNEAQRSAVETIDGPSLVIAGAGSGKTRVLTFRIAHLLEQGNKAKSILALTFTNKAAREMKERIASIVGHDVARYLWMGTFHSIFARILRIESDVIGYPSNFTIYDTADAKSIVRSIIRDMKLDDKTYKTNVILGRISGAKNNLVTPNAYAESKAAKDYDASLRMPLIANIYKEYAKRCAMAGAMDFDDLLMKTNLLFHHHPEVLEKYQNQFKYVLVDEYQDTNHAQYRIIKSLAAEHKNICVVGDDAQSIYSFRGAKIENILNFQTDYPTHSIFKLEQNYRSTQTIVDAANSVIAKNQKQLKKKVFSENKVGDQIKVLSALNDNEEGYLVAGEIGELRMREHLNYEDFAILYRTNAQSRIFEETLRKRNIPYKIYGGMSFYQRKEIKDILCYIRLSVNYKDNEALKRIINYPARGIGQTTMEKLENASLVNETSIWEVIENLGADNNIGLNKGTVTKINKFTLLIKGFAEKIGEIEAFDMAKQIAADSGLLKDLYNDTTPEGVSRHENVQELLNGIKEFSVSAREEGRENKLANYMEDVALLTDQDNEKDEDRDRVTLMTVHSAKGLEFKTVFVVGMEDKLFPAQYSGQLTQHEMEEERRLFYVAITRAEDRAYLSWARQRYKWGRLEFCEPSKFISEIDDEFLDAPGFTGRGGRADAVASGGIVGSRSKNKSFQVQKRQEANGRLQNMVKLKAAGSQNPDFKGDAPEKIQPGMVVEHQRFGKGKVLQIEGVAPDIKATVFFPTSGQKHLLLKFAKLRIVNS
ncbi:ATP-dependent DNA helicase [Puteibacter caeruleilacunae]|nr:ATP-dependent DNA helicase [Puteibacter caeruleilacunae]